MAQGPPGPDPYAADRALAEWATAKGYPLSVNPDLAWYRGWYPTTYFFRLNRVGRELRVQQGDTSVFLVEGFEADPLKQAAGEDRHVCAFVLCPRIGPFRAAVRSKSGGGIVNEMASGLGSLFSGKAAGTVLGDPTFEAKFDVTTPSRDEGNRALSMPLRQALLQNNWRGVLERRAGGLIVVSYDKRAFDVAGLEWTLGMLATIVGLSVG